MSVILIVDDDPISLQLLDLILNRGGYEVIVAGTAKTGLQLFYQHRPDIVIIDDMMPEMSGGEMCRHLKNDPEASHTPIILISAGLRIQNQSYVQMVGADTALVKPTLSKDVLAAVASCLGLRS